jgi:hypothetical protein
MERRWQALRASSDVYLTKDFWREIEPHARRGWRARAPFFPIADHRLDTPAPK